MSAEKLDYYISLHHTACLGANSEWNFRFNGAQRAKIETLAELKLSLSPMLKAWFNKVPLNCIC